MDPISQLTHIVPMLIDTVDQISAEQLNDPTPCDKFTVHDVIDHMIVMGGALTAAFAGEEPGELLPPPVYGRVPAAEFAEAMNNLLAAAMQPGTLDKTVTSPMGDMTGDQLARFVAFDGLVHGWDLASATGQDVDIDDAVVTSVDEFIRTALTTAMRDGETFAAENAAPEPATPIERVAAFSGRAL